MTSNLKLRQQRAGIPLDTNLQGRFLTLVGNSGYNNSRRGIPERRNRRRRAAILALIGVPLVWYSLHHLYFHKNPNPTPLLPAQQDTTTREAPTQQQQQHEEPSRHIRFDTPLLLFTCKRHEYLNRTLAAIYKFHPMGSNGPNAPWSHVIMAGAPIIVSQDGQDLSVAAVIQYYQTLFQSIHVPLFHIQHIPDKNTDTSLLQDPYQALSQHYAWALEQVFSGKAYPSSALVADPEDVDSHFNTMGIMEPIPQRVILLEEDIDIAVDFFSYMSATAPLLDQDSTLLAISAYNDNGKQDLVGDPYRLLRSDFFPGLGWMMHSSLWKQIQPWPRAYWDDWLREPTQRRGRHIIRPEISRTFHFGTRGGASSNQYSHHLDTILLNTENVDWNQQDLSYLDKEIFMDTYKQDIALARDIRREDYGEEEQFVTHVMNVLHTDSVKILYKDWNEFVQLAHLFDLMDNEKAGVPRTALEGIVECRPHGHGGNLLYLVPS